MSFSNPRASDFREEVTVLSDTDTPDGRGGQTSTEVDGETFFARVEEKVQSKVFEGGTQVAVKQYVVTLRDGPSSDILKEKRLEWVTPEDDTVILRVLGLESSERRRTSSYLCEQVPADR